MAYFLPILLLLYLAYMANRKRKTAILRKMIQNRNTEDKTKMKELAKQFIGKECLVYAFDNSQQFDGVIKEVTDGALLIEKKRTDRSGESGFCDPHS
ncbi:MAG: hypothetical protein IJN42_07360 [Clostridia bacterium]|nr:hypothetical protein [Clostridia bacterium]